MADVDRAQLVHESEAEVFKNLEGVQHTNALSTIMSVRLIGETCHNPASML